MPNKIEAQSGISLADIYDVPGSQAGPETLFPEEVHLVHELGATIFSERLATFLLLADSTAVAQSTVWDIVLAGIPDSINRLASIAVIADVAGRVDHCQVSIGEPCTGADQIIWAWDNAVDSQLNVRAFGGNIILLRPVVELAGGAPNLLTRTGTCRLMPNLIFRGISTAFGAGTVQAQAMIQVIRANPGAPGPGEPSSHGLPLPSW